MINGFRKRLHSYVNSNFESNQNIEWDKDKPKKPLRKHLQVIFGKFINKCFYFHCPKVSNIYRVYGLPSKGLVTPMFMEC